MVKEFDLIEKFFKPLTNSNRAAQNLDDDVAKLTTKKGEKLVVSKDVFVEGVHFLRKDGGYKIATKLLRTNISDIASAGAKPLYYLLGFSKNKYTNHKFLQEFCRGLKDTQNEFDLSLIGGDTVYCDKMVFSITIFGTVKNDRALGRSNAKVGDLIYVSGSIGDAFLGLKGMADKFLQQRHFFPNPRVNLGLELTKNKLSHCAIDVSDGLLADLNHICKSSKVSAIIHEEKIPFSKAAKKILKNFQDITKLDLLCGGDDYELIFTSPQKNAKKIHQLSQTLDLNLSCIGKIVESHKKHEVKLCDQSGAIVKTTKLGYEH